MNLKRHYLLCVVILSTARLASGQNFTGSVGIQEDATQTGSYTASSLMLDASNYTEPFSASGTFASTVPNGTEVFAYSSDITGLSTTLQSESIADFLVIGGAGPSLFGSPGTTPVDRFDFNLQSLQENSDGDFTGYGTLVDNATTGAYANTEAEVLLSFSGPNNYSFTLQAVPEPASITLLFAGLGMLPFIRRKS